MAGTVATVYGFKFPLNKAVSVPNDATIGETGISIPKKLRNNSHFFEGDEAELKAAKDAGEVTFTKAPKKIAKQVRYVGMRKGDMPGAVASAGADD